MIQTALHKNPVALDREKHRQLKFRRHSGDFSAMAALNAYYINAVEILDAGREYPVVFVKAGEDEKGVREVAPVAVFGLQQGENLFLEGARWNAQYVPAQLRAYPFALVPTGETDYAVVVDRDAATLSESEGEALFGDDGQPSAMLREIQQFLETLHAELQRTRAFCARLVELGLLQDMRFDATLPDGQKITVDGFAAIDEAKLQALPDDKVVELHRSGMLGLIHLQQASMTNMRRLVERRLARQAQA